MPSRHHTTHALLALTSLDMVDADERFVGGWPGWLAPEEVYAEEDYIYLAGADEPDLDFGYPAGVPDLVDQFDINAACRDFGIGEAFAS